MSNVVFILGAGASKTAGAPLMADFLDTAFLFWKGRRVQRAPAFELVFRAIAALQQVHSKADLDIQNLEAVFGAFEMAVTLRALRGLDEREVAALTDSMVDVIVSTLEESVRFTYGSEGLRPAGDYDAFVQLLQALRRAGESPRTVAVLTFNYDLGADWALEYHDERIDYGLGDPAIPSGSIALLKLHGSLNWGYCEGCKSVVPVKLAPFVSNTISLRGNAKVSLRIPLAAQQHPCGGRLRAQPLLVPPTWSKAQFHRTIASVWQRAAAELSDAENIFILGYSLPETDQFFRFLYGLGTIGQPLRRIWVCNPDPAVGTRFERLLGSGARQRFQFKPMPFGTAISDIKVAMARDAV